MGKYLSYPWAALYGFYFYGLFQLMYIIRFGEVNINFSVLDIFIWAVGAGSILLLMYFMQKLSHGRSLMFIPFIIALPIAYIGAFVGGLLGVPGVLLFGLAPFAIVLSLGYWVIGRFASGIEI